jgi:hypothetical protein
MPPIFFGKDSANPLQTCLPECLYTYGLTSKFPLELHPYWITLATVSVAFWKKCSSCKKEIPLGGTYYVCSVTTCQSKVTNYAFCSVSCWDAHLPIERHRSGSAGAIERKAPFEAEAAKKIVVARPSAAGDSAAASDEILVVVSKVRKYIHDRSGMNTSASAYEALTEQVKRLCDAAIDVARADSRKTVMDRDFK